MPEQLGGIPPTPTAAPHPVPAPIPGLGPGTSYVASTTVAGELPSATGILGQNGRILSSSGQVVGSGSGHTPTGDTVGAVWGDSLAGNGVYGSSAGFNGVEGDSWSAQHAGVAGVNNAGGPGVWGTSTGNAGQFEGNVQVDGLLTVKPKVGGKIALAGGAALWCQGACDIDGNVNLTGTAATSQPLATITGDVYLDGTLIVTKDVDLKGADCAEQFDVVDAQQLEPGTVVVIDQGGALRESRDAYDKKVAGIVSGAGGYRPGIILDRNAADPSRTMVALVGKVYCKVDAAYAPIEMGDLLTTSPTPGHAMKASDPICAFGAVIGKALRPLASGAALIPVLVALQ